MIGEDSSDWAENEMMDENLMPPIAMSTPSKRYVLYVLFVSYLAYL